MTYTLPLVAHKRSLSSSILTGRDQQQQQQTQDIGPGGPGPGLGFIIPVDSSQPGFETMDCNSKSKDHHKDDDHKDDGHTDNQADNNNNNVYSNVAPDMNPAAMGIGPATTPYSRRHVRSRPKVSHSHKPSIFERDDRTIDANLARHLQQRAASRKRAMRRRTSRGAN